MQEFNALKGKNQVIEEYSKKHLTEKGHKALCECWDWVEFATDRELENKRVYNVISCKKRVCAICSSRDAFKTAGKISVIVDFLSHEYNQDFLFVTCSRPNVKAEDLDGEGEHINKSIKRLMQIDAIESVVNGCLRKIEYTYNAEKKITADMWHGKKRYRNKPMAEYFSKQGLKIGDDNPNYDTYHLHIHMLWAVDKQYFKSRSYIKHEKFVKLWQRSCRSETPPHFHIKRYRKPKEGSSDIHEIAKYATKVDDRTHSQEVFSTLYDATYKKKLITYSGLFKKASTLYKEYLEAKKENKPHIMDKYVKKDTTEYVYLLVYKWLKLQYTETERRYLSDTELAYIKRLD
jgi:plasmid rolling circle replication initiator protein Rep